MDLGEIIFLSIICIVVFVVLIAILSPKAKKGDDTPAFLAAYFYPFVDILNTFPFNLIFEEYSNDGSEIIYKEKTKSRNVFLSVERYKLKLFQKDSLGKIIFSTEIEEDVGAGIAESRLIELIHELYVNNFSD